MTFLAPAFLAAAAVVSLALVGLHFLATKQPDTTPLPTIRFVPDRSAEATTRDIRLSHLLLLALRVLVVMAIGAALARPVLQPARRTLARVVVLDAGVAVAYPAAARDSALAWLRDGDILVVVDTAARTIATGGRDSLSRLAADPIRPAGSDPASLSAGLVAALRAGSALRERADSIELVLVSPFADGSLDAATATIRSQWPGRARLVRLEGAAPVPEGTAAEVQWAGVERPPRALARARVDTVGAVVAGQDIVVAPFERRWEYSADSARGARVIARWIDGAPAALEWPAEGGCARSTVVPRDTVGDLVVRPEFGRLAAVLGATCASGGPYGTLAEPVLALLAGSPGAASRADLAALEGRRSRLAPWLLGLALMLALVELLVRRRGARA